MSANGTIKETTRDQINKLSSEGYFTWEIANELNISEAQVVSVLHPDK